MKGSTRLYIGTVDGIRTIDVDGNGGGVEEVGVLKLEHAAARIAVSAANRGRVYVAAYESGLWRSDDAGTTWQGLKSYPEPYAHSVAVDPENEDLVYAGSEPAALHRSKDGGESWEECRAFGAVPESAQWGFHGNRKSHVRELRFAPGNRELLYAGIEVGGIVRSRDGGSTWEQLGGTDPDIHTIHVSDSRPETVYAATANGPYRSDDGGDTWTHINSGLARRYSVPVSVAPGDHRRVFASVSDNPGRRSGAHAYMSTDAGESWSQLDLGADDDMVIAYAWDHQDANRVYAGTDSGKLYVSPDAGDSWLAIDAGLDSIAVGALAVGLGGQGEASCSCN